MGISSENRHGTYKPALYGAIFWAVSAAAPAQAVILTTGDVTPPLNVAGSLDTNAIISVGDSGAGGAGSGSLLIDNGSDLTYSGGTQIHTIGFNETGTATVEGAGSSWTDAAFFFVGEGGQGTFNILIGASAKGFAEGSGGGINIGQNNIGTLNMSNGALFEGVNMNVGLNPGSNGTANIDDAQIHLFGASSSGARSSLTIGLGGPGTVNLTNGANFLVDGITPHPSGVASPDLSRRVGFSVGFGAAAGELNISGQDADGNFSELRVTGKRQRGYVGNNGQGEANVFDGGRIIMEDPDSQSLFRLGSNAGATGELNVWGADSRVETGRFLEVGNNGNGILNIGDNPDTAPVEGGGTVFTTTRVRVARNAGSTGLLNVAKDGTLVSPNVLILDGGTLTGNGGSIIGNVRTDATRGGKIAPGDGTAGSLGIMKIFGDLFLSNDDTAMVSFDIAGSNIALVEYDQINAFNNTDTDPTIDGNISIDGDIAVQLIGGYMPSTGDFFDVFTAEMFTILSPTLALPALNAGLAWQTGVVGIDGGRFAYRLEVAAAQVPEPGTLAIFVMGLAGLGFMRRRRSAQADGYVGKPRNPATAQP